MHSADFRVAPLEQPEEPQAQAVQGSTPGWPEPWRAVRILVVEQTVHNHVEGEGVHWFEEVDHRTADLAFRVRAYWSNHKEERSVENLEEGQSIQRHNLDQHTHHTDLLEEGRC
jgi:hypothetical protein